MDSVYDIAVKKGYIVFKGSSDAMIRESNMFFKYCSRNGVPHIAVKNRSKYSTIEIDAITLSPEQENRWIKPFNRELNQYILKLKKEGIYERRRSIVDYCSETNQANLNSIFTMIETKKEDAEIVAQEVFYLFRKVKQDEGDVDNE